MTLVTWEVRVVCLRNWGVSRCLSVLSLNFHVVIYAPFNTMTLYSNYQKSSWDCSSVRTSGWRIPPPSRGWSDVPTDVPRRSCDCWSDMNLSADGGTVDCISFGLHRSINDGICSAIGTGLWTSGEWTSMSMAPLSFSFSNFSCSSLNASTWPCNCATSPPTSCTSFVESASSLLRGWETERGTLLEDQINTKAYR